MLNFDECAVICDLAETYHVLDYGSLPVKLVAALVVGLRENSRIKMKLAEMPASQEAILLAGIADRIDAFRYGFMDGIEPPPGALETMFGIVSDKTKDGVKVFDSVEDFNAELERLRGN